MKWILILVVFFTLSCKHEEILLNKPRENESTLAVYLSNNSEYTLFTHALQRTGLLDTLNTDHEFTVLAIKNSIYAKVGILNTSHLEEIELESLREQMALHILPQKLTLDEIPMDQYNVEYNTILGEKIKVQKSKMKIDTHTGSGPVSIRKEVVDEMVSFSGSMVINKVSLLDENLPLANDGDIVLENGVIHNINKPIQWKSKTLIHEYLEENPRYSIFVEMLKHFGYWSALQQNAKSTLFVPNNSFLESIGITKEYILGLEPEGYNTTLLLGSYMLDGIEYLLSDYTFFLNKDLQYWFQGKVDNKFYNIITGLDYPYPYHQIHYYTGVNRVYVGISDLPEPANYSLMPYGADDCSRFLGIGGLRTGPSPDLILKYENYCTAFTGDIKYCDIHLQNGVVHELEGVLVLPEQARL